RNLSQMIESDISINDMSNYPKLEESDSVFKTIETNPTKYFGEKLETNSISFSKSNKFVKVQEKNSKYKIYKWENDNFIEQLKLWNNQNIVNINFEEIKENYKLHIECKKNEPFYYYNHKHDTVISDEIQEFNNSRFSNINEKMTERLVESILL